MDQPSLGMPNRDYYLDENKRNATLPGYQQFMHDYLTKLWNDKDTLAGVESTYDEVALNQLIDDVS